MNWTYLGLAVAFAIAGIAVAMAALAHIRIANAQSEIRALRKIVEAQQVAGSLRFGKEYVKVLDLERVIRGMGYRQEQRGWVELKSEAGMDSRFGHVSYHGTYWGSKEQVDAYAAGIASAQASVARARLEALEEAAKAMEEMDHPGGPFMDGESCAEVIRALITTEACTNPEPAGTAGSTSDISS